MEPTEIREELEQVWERVEAAARRASRNPDSVTLVGVTKTHPAEVVVAAVAAGLRHIGENRPEELALKRQDVERQLGPAAAGLTWHMIGHVQSRKAAQAAEAADMIHSVDSVKLASRLDRSAAELGRRLPVLLELNLSGEVSKYGLSVAEWQTSQPQWAVIAGLVRDIQALPNLDLQGLMTMAPWVPDERVVRPVFRSARLLLERLERDFPAVGWRHLSMGMTDDYELAIEEGATLIRVGRAIFGTRRET